MLLFILYETEIIKVCNFIDSRKRQLFLYAFCFVLYKLVFTYFSLKIFVKQYYKSLAVNTKYTI